MTPIIEGFGVLKKFGKFGCMVAMKAVKKEGQKLFLDLSWVTPGNKQSFYSKSVF